MTQRISDIVINLSLQSLAREKLIRDGGYSLQDWKKECTLAFIAVAEELTPNITQASKLIKCDRETIYYAKGISSRQKKQGINNIISL